MFYFKYCLSVHPGSLFVWLLPCLLKGFLYLSLSVDFRTVTTCFHFSLLATHTERRKRPLKASFPLPPGKDD